MMNPTTHRIAASVALLLCVSSATLADPPDGYYDSVDASNSTTLRTTLHGVIDDHTRFPYTSGNTDTWDILELADQDPNDADHILDVYKNASYHKIGGGNGSYNREHTWPNSYGFPDDGGVRRRRGVTGGWNCGMRNADCVMRGRVVGHAAAR